MQLESHAIEVLATRARGAFELALDATVADARKRASKHRRTGAWMDSIGRTSVVERGNIMSARIGSPLVSWRAHELGAFIQAKERPLKFVYKGRWVTIPIGDGVRIPAQPAIIPAVRRSFGSSYREAMAGYRVRAARTGSRTARPDFRSGRYRAR